MPSSATITSFITLIAGSKARASHVNTNFSNFRGHLLPIDPNTAASANATYDLGASDAKWRRIYLDQAPFINGQQLGKLEIETVFDASTPADQVEDFGYGLGAIAFEQDTSTAVVFQFTVPDDYSATNRISLNIKGFAETGGTHFTMQTETALYRPGLSGVGTIANLTAPSNVLTSTSNINPPTTTATFFSDTSLRLCNTGGTINSITLASGDVLQVRLSRQGTATADTNAGYFYLTNIVVDLNN